ncbi:hypothetical protein CcaCcLH18_03114 [Colletotrichum camelliae]|nr:hypothetical protein CcaCcLH18_03114 [Colletotrichum camelliae]
MRFVNTIAMFLAVAAASPVAVTDENSAIKEIDGIPAVDINSLQPLEARSVDDVKDIISRDVDVKNSLEVRASWPASHQSDHFRAGNGYANRISTRITINGISVVCIAWFNDIHTLFMQFSPNFPSANYVMAGFEDLATGLQRNPWRLTWDTIYTLSTRAGEIFQFGNEFVMWWN